MTDETDDLKTGIRKEVATPKEVIASDSAFEDEIQEVIGLTSDLEDFMSDAEYIQAQEKVEQIQEIVNRMHVYLEGKIE